MRTAGTRPHDGFFVLWDDWFSVFRVFWDNMDALRKRLSLSLSPCVCVLCLCMLCVSFLCFLSLLCLVLLVFLSLWVLCFWPLCLVLVSPVCFFSLSVCYSSLSVLSTDRYGREAIQRASSRFLESCAWS